MKPRSHTLVPRGISRLTAVLAVLTIATACEDPGPSGAEDQPGNPGQSQAVITGTLDYRERVALTDRAVAEITLEDVSRQDTAAEVLSRQRITNPGQVPIRYELPYNPEDIDLRHAYAVRGRISDRGRLLFTSDSHTPVLTRGGGRVARLLLTAVPDPAREPDTQAAGPGPQAEPQALRGMFRYFADAANFRDCATGQVYPVAIEGAYLELERAYLNSGIPPTKEMLVELQGRYEERPSMEYNNPEIKLIVDIFDKSLPEKSCVPGGMESR